MSSCQSNCRANYVWSRSSDLLVPFDVQPEVRVVMVPSHCLSDALCPGRLFSPAQLLQLLTSDWVTKVDLWPAGDELNPVVDFRFCDILYHHNEFLCQLDNGNLEACSYVVDLSHRPFLQDQQEGLDGVADEQEVAGHRQGSLNGAFLVFLQQREKPGNNLLWELSGPVDIVAPGDDDGKLIVVPVGSDQILCSCFSSSIRIGRPQRAVLIKRLIQAGSVYFIRAYVDEAQRLVLSPTGSIQQNLGSVHVDPLETT